MINEIAVEVRLNDHDAKERIREIDQELRKLDKSRVKIQAEIDNLPKLNAQLNDIQNQKAKISKDKIRLEAETSNLKSLYAQLDEIQAKKQALNNEKIRIQADLSGIKNLKNEILGIDKQILEYKNLRTSLRQDLSSGSSTNVAQTKKDIAEVSLEIEKLNNKKAELNLQIKDYDSLKNRLSEIRREVDSLNKKEVELKARIRDGERAESELQKLEAKAEKLDDKEVDLRTRIQNAEQAKRQLDDIHREATRLDNQQATIKTKLQDYEQTKARLLELKSIVEKSGTWFQNAGKSMRTMLGNNGNNPLGKLSHFLVQGIGYSALYRGTSGLMNSFSNSFSKGIERFDVINAGKRTLGALNFDQKTIDTQLEKLQDNILGLPTSIDQAIGEVTKISAVTNDLPRAVRAYDALNNSILAFGGDAEQSQRAINQVSQSLGKGVIDAQTYNSLINNNMTPAMKKVAEMFGYSGEELGKFKSALGEGEISANQFLDALIKLNEEGSEGMQALQQLAKENAFASISSGFTNMQNRLAKGWQNILENTNSALNDLGYDSLPVLISKVGDFGQKQLEGIGKWISENKETIGAGIDWILGKIEEFKQGFEDFDISSFLRGGIDLLKEFYDTFHPIVSGIIDTAKDFATFIGGGDMSKGFGKMLIGWVGGSYILQGFGTAIKMITSSAKAISKAKKILGGGSILGTMSNLIGSKKTSSDSFDNVTQSLSGMERLKNSLGNFDVGGFLNKASNLALLAGVAGDIILFAEAVKQINEKVPNPEEMEQFGLKCLMLGGVMTSFGVLFGLGSTAINAAGASQFGAGLAVILGMSVDIMAFAEAVQQIDEKVPEDFGSMGNKLLTMGEVFLAFGTVIGVLGTAITMIGPAAGIIGAGIAGLIGLAASIVIVTEQFSAIAFNLKKIDNNMPDDLDAGSFREKVDTMLQCIDAISSSADEILGRGIASLFDASYYSDLEQTTSDIAKIMNSLKKVDNIEFNGETVISRIQSMKSVMNEIKGISMPALNISSQTAENLAETLSNLSKMATECKKLNDVDLNFDATKISNAVLRLKEVANAFKDVTFPDGKANFKAEDAENMLRTFQALSQVVEPMNKFNDSMKDFKGDTTYEKVQQLGVLLGQINADYISYDFKAFPDNQDVENVLKGIQTFSEIAKAISEFSKASESYNTIDGNVLMSKVVSFFEDFTNYKLDELINTFNTQSQNFSSVKTGISNFVKIVDELIELNGKSIDTENIKAVVKGVKDCFEALSEDEDTFKIDSDVIEKINTAKAAVKALQSMMNSIQTIAGMSINWQTLGVGEGGLINQVNLFLQDVESLNAGDAQMAISDVQSVLDQLNQMLTTMQGMSDQFLSTGENWGLNLWQGFESQDVKGKMVQYAEEIARLMKSKAASFREVGTTWGKALDAGFRDAVSYTGANAASEVVSGLNGKIGEISSAGSALGNAFAEAFNSATANLKTPNLGRSVESKGSKSSGTHSSTPVKFASGGQIEWKKSGTDTVPAMLTPGEFVIKKKAVDHTGLRILDKINRMDLKGAYHELQAKFGEQQIINNQFITNNYTTNNDNRKIEINETRNRRKQELRANRFLRGMA